VEAAEQEHQAGVDADQQGGEQPVDEGPVDQPVDVVQPVLEHGHGHRHRDEAEDREQVAGAQDQGGGDEHQHHRDHGVHEPLDLLALLPGGPAQAQHHRQQGGGQHPGAGR
jgi:hypothetical protein